MKREPRECIFEPGTAPFALVRRTFRRCAGLVAILGLMAMATETAGAAVIEYDYSGTITSADPSTGVAPGTRFSGTFAYDPNSPWALSIDTWISYVSGHVDGFPWTKPDTSGLTLQVGNNSVYAHQGGVELAVGYEWANPQQYDTWPPKGVSLTISDHVNGNPVTVSLGLDTPNHRLFPLLALPSSISLADFPNATLNVTQLVPGSGEKTLYTGTIDTLQEVVQTPEPSALAFPGVVALGLLARRWRRRRTAD